MAHTQMLCIAMKVILIVFFCSSVHDTVIKYSSVQDTLQHCSVHDTPHNIPNNTALYLIPHNTDL